jgi:hypothetical protein
MAATHAGRFATKSGRAALASVVIALGLLSSPGFGQEPAAVPSFPAQANAITADVVVLDKQGRPVRGVRQEEFTLLADGKAQTIVGFEARELATTPGTPATTVGDERVASNEGGTKGRTFVFLIDDLCEPTTSPSDITNCKTPRRRSRDGYVRKPNPPTS